MSADLDLEIRRAEMTVVESDRRLLHTVRRLAPATRGATQRAAWIGGASLAVIASTWLVARALARPAPLPRRRKAAPLRPPVPIPPPARGWRRAMELGGALMGSALRSGLAPAAGQKAAAAPMALAAAWRWLHSARAPRR